MKRRLPALLLALLCLAGCGGSGPKSLTGELEPGPPALRPLTEQSAAALTEFSLELLKENWEGETLLLSPLSVLSALGMTANGARGTTLEEMEAVFGLPVEELNAALAAWRSDLPQGEGCQADLANAIWFRDGGGLTVEPDFLQTALDWYGAEVFPSQFDAAAVREVNGWVEKNTHGMIDRIVDQFSGVDMLCLVNALALDAEWAEVYDRDAVLEDRIFTTEDGREQNMALMYSTEDHYMKDEGAQGFWKPYKGGRWAFAALLPDEDMGLEAYLASLTGERLRALLLNGESREVRAAIPQFECEYGKELSGCLTAMGMPAAFDRDRADFSGMGSSGLDPLYISRVLHRTYISVDDRGTKAAAATMVAMAGGAGPSEPDPVPVVILDRPFLYMLVDTGTNLPAFIGAVTSLE